MTGQQVQVLTTALQTLLLKFQYRCACEVILAQQKEANVWSYFHILVFLAHIIHCIYCQQIQSHKTRERPDTG